MRQITLEELKQIQIGILKRVDEFCTENSISYWIDCGTLLGAIRHKGYIPWDDDIDIGMLREDYNRFMETFNKQNSRYLFKCFEQDPEFLYPSGKVLDTHTVLYEPDRSGQKIAVNIDVFVYDLAPEDMKKCKTMYDKRDLLRKLHQQRNSTYKIQGSILKVMVGNVTRAVLRLFPENYFVKAMINNSRKHINNPHLTEVGNFTSYARIKCPIENVNKVVRVPFEEYEFNAPIGYDNWLRAFYKDYMSLPPLEKQVSHHRFEAFIED